MTIDRLVDDFYSQWSQHGAAHIKDFIKDGIFEVGAGIGSFSRGYIHKYNNYKYNLDGEKIDLKKYLQINKGLIVPQKDSPVPKRCKKQGKFKF